jgi:hypothetical protein
MTKLAVGQIVYTAMCHETGGMIDDGTVFRLGPANFRWVCGDDWCGVWLRQLAAERGLQAWVRSSTDQLSNVAVQGPLSRALLAPLVTTPAHRPGVAELGWFRFTTGRIGDLPRPNPSARRSSGQTRWPAAATIPNACWPAWISWAPTPSRMAIRSMPGGCRSA